jgi:hypothetical protein
MTRATVCGAIPTNANSADPTRPTWGRPPSAVQLSKAPLRSDHFPNKSLPSRPADEPALSLPKGICKTRGWSSRPVGEICKAKKFLIPTNGRAWPELAEGDLQFGFWAAQRFSAAIHPALEGALAPGAPQ